jgi:hypothetical protein
MDTDPARDPARVKPAPAGPELESPVSAETEAGAPVAATSGDLLQRPDIGGRGNGPVRVAAVQRLQRAYGNRGAQRYLQRHAAPTAVQRDGAALPAVPDVRLTTPSLLQPPDPAARYHLGGDEHLHLDPAVQAMVTTGVRQQIDPTLLRTALAGVRLGPMPAGGAPNALSGPPTPTPAPLVTPGAGPATPHAGGAGDVMDALLGIHVIDQAVTAAQTRVLEQITVDWSRLRTPERIGVVSTVAVIGLGALGGAMTDPGARQFLIGQLNGRVLPVPGVDWLHLEVNTGGDNLMLGLHVDVGRLLPPILGFGPGSPSAIGGPPQPEPFVPGQRKAAGAAMPPATGGSRDT